MSPEELDVLVKRVQEGDIDAFSDIFVAVQKPVRIFLSVYASTEEMVEEVLQAAFVLCYEKIRTYRPRRTFLPWLKGIARNLLLQHLAERARFLAAEGDELEGIMVRSGLASLRRGEQDAERVGRLKECLEKLPSHSRDLIERRYASDISLKAMASLFRKTETWVAVTLCRIREALRECMAKAESNV